MTSKYLWIFLILMSCTIFSQEQKYIPYRKGNLWGLCDANGFIAVQPQYNSISGYDHSVGGFHAEQNGKFGIIDHNAVILMPFISNIPISVNDDKYLVFDGWDYYYYSVKTRIRLGKYIEPKTSFVGDRGWGNNNPLYSKHVKEIKLSWNDLDDEDLGMIQPFDNDQYELNYKLNFIEILEGSNNYIGIYIPKLKKMFLNTPEIAYVGWQYYQGKPYILTTNNSKLFGLADENSREIYPIQYSTIDLIDTYQLVILSEPDPGDYNNLIFKTILPNNKVLHGRFEPATTILKNGYPFQLYYTMINGQENYAGEDGTLYFEG
ncbi:MAG: hypothetical protein ACN6OB_00250 [Chryseobacterium jejuense]